MIPVWLFCLVWLIPNNTIPPTSEHDISPSLVPSIAAATALLTSIMMAWRAWRTSAEDAKGMDDEFGAEATGINGSVLINVGLWTLGATVCWAIITHVGFEPGMAVLLAATMFYIGVRRAVPLIGTAIVMPILLSQATWYFFTTEMPGIWR